ncbi:MAG: HAD-IIIA family hydrolase, partial [Gammaproteobacteria bacterium]|nr:HAD-IIIA family hydrolase [Gammaproteobacteria bacterium]
RIFICPHAPDDGCDCRKPKPGLLLQAAEYFACGLQNMVFVGDKKSDVEAANAAGVMPVLVRTGYGATTVGEWQGSDRPPVFDDLAAYAGTLTGDGG